MRRFTQALTGALWLLGCTCGTSAVAIEADAYPVRPLRIELAFRLAATPTSSRAPWRKN